MEVIMAVTIKEMNTANANALGALRGVPHRDIFGAFGDEMRRRIDVPDVVETLLNEGGSPTSSRVFGSSEPGTFTVSTCSIDGVPGVNVHITLRPGPRAETGLSRTRPDGTLEWETVPTTITAGAFCPKGSPAAELAELLTMGDPVNVEGVMVEGFRHCVIR
jgi:hypothetical protein